jgi:hypothetical protein
VAQPETPTEVLLGLGHALNFARRYYALVAATRASEPNAGLPPAQIASELEATGRAFRFNRKKRFYATREVNTPGELGLNLAINGSVEFILVACGPGGHFGPTFHGLAFDLAERHAPELIPSPHYPRPAYASIAELRQVLTGGLGLYTELAAAIQSSGLLDSEQVE